MSQRKECVLNSFESGKNVPGGNTRIIHILRENLKVIEYLRGETVQRRHRRIIVEDYVKLFQEGIEQVQVCTKLTRFGVLEELREAP
jgi:hypothetical protein